MKYLVGLSRIFVGVLFIISGLIKLNDPVGFSFKLKDYFAPEVLNLEFLVPYALLLAFFVVVFEVMLGVMILLGYARKFTLWSILLLIVFFTFLTFYSAYFNKVTDCGCFGDAIKLTPWESFIKDIVLLVLILIIFYGKQHIKPLFSNNIRKMVVYVSFIGCLIFGYYVLQHLPVIDFRPYKIGANILEGMSYPENAQKPIFEYRWKFNINGNEKVVITQGEYPDQEGEFLGVETKVLQKGYEPPIHDFTMERDDVDHTQDLMQINHLVMVVAYSLSNSEIEGFEHIKKVTDEAMEKGYKVIGLSASSLEKTESLIVDQSLRFDFYFCDETTLKTIIRSNPAIMEIQNGTIMQKHSWQDASKLELRDLN
jgi:uncharacterized membrane protein YphA (DoxX/SURF4 family)/peroxiredoxin